MKTPLSFVQRNAFLLIGLIVLLAITMALGTGWYFYYQKRLELAAPRWLLP